MTVWFSHWDAYFGCCRECDNEKLVTSLQTAMSFQTTHSISCLDILFCFYFYTLCEIISNICLLAFLPLISWIKNNICAFIYFGGGIFTLWSTIYLYVCMYICMNVCMYFQYKSFWNIFIIILTPEYLSISQ